MSIPDMSIPAMSALAMSMPVITVCPIAGMPQAKPLPAHMAWARKKLTRSAVSRRVRGIGVQDIRREWHRKVPARCRAAVATQCVTVTSVNLTRKAPAFGHDVGRFAQLDSIPWYKVQISTMNAAGLSTMRIGEVAECAGVNVQTLRYYERRGLLPSPTRRPSGYREYSPETVALVRFIKRAQHLGFSLRDVEELLGLRKNLSRNRAAVRAIAVRQVADIAARIRRLAAMQKTLEQLATECECGSISTCPIIEALDDDPVPDVVVPERQPLSRGSHVRV
jgi:Cu(I)-responsive transcriptional regulator